MSIRFTVLLALAPLVASGKPLPELRATDYVRNPSFVVVPPGRALDTPAGAVEQVGEVVILEGDAELVSSDGMGGFGVVFDQSTQNPVSISNRFFTKYGDEFDEIILLTTFDDTGAQGALAYEISTQQDVKGLGLPLFDDTGPGGWGGDQHRLHAFVNMMRWDQFRDFDGIDETDPRSGFYTTLGQEFAHRWLAFMRYVDASGVKSTAMLGRQLAHWASTLQADASVMDGDRLLDDGDGTFTNAEAFDRYSALDLYGMGLLGASDVAPWFVVHNAFYTSGTKVDPAQYMRVGAKFSGQREDITMAQVIAAEGARAPAWDQAPHSFRAAFVLLTRPGERAADVTDAAHTIEVMRRVWEDSFARFSGGRGTVCTQVSAPCGAPTAKVTAGQVVEAGGNGNGIVEPGEPVTVQFTLDNDGPMVAKPVSVTASGQGLDVSKGVATVAQLAPGQSVEVSFSGTIPNDAPCGQSVEVRAESVVSGHTFRGFVDLTPGMTDRVRDDFESGAGDFGVNLDGKDTTTTNGWQFGTPLEYRGRSGFVFQPGACAGGSQRCWFTGLSRGHRPKTDSSVGAGTATLWSPPLDLAGTLHPVLKYTAWYEAIDFSNPQAGGQVNGGLALVVEATADGGKSWVQLDSLGGGTPQWQPREVPLDGALPLDGRIQLRFSASSPDATQLVEAGIDDLAIVTQTPACGPAAVIPPEMPPAPAGCACAVGSPRSAAVPLALILVAGIALAFARRRRRRF